MYITMRPEVKKEFLHTEVSPTKKSMKEVQVSKGADVVNEWNLDINEILSSPRKVRGKFHVPKVDKDNEFIENEAVQRAVPDFMHFPILHDFHKERPVGIVTRVVELNDGTFDFEGLIKATKDCDDVWNLIETGNYNQVSIFGRRTEGSPTCNMRPEQRSAPCNTTGLRLDSISVCDENARNDGTSLTVVKAGKLVFDANNIIKAEDTNSTLMHTATDYPRKKDCAKARIEANEQPLPRAEPKNRLKDFMEGKTDAVPVPQYERGDMGKTEKKGGGND
jgi:hypothetical protein